LFFNKKNTIGLLSHPLFLLVIGAIISSIIIPVYTNQWQNYQKELEIKSKLAEEISRSFFIQNFLHILFLIPMDMVLINRWNLLSLNQIKH